jgi:hypothetical protein
MAAHLRRLAPLVIELAIERAPSSALYSHCATTPECAAPFNGRLGAPQAEFVESPIDASETIWLPQRHSGGRWR